MLAGCMQRGTVRSCRIGAWGGHLASVSLRVKGSPIVGLVGMEVKGKEGL